MSCEVSDKSKNDSSKADHLNTRIPYGIRPVVKVRSYTLIVFQSTHPVWDATRRVQAFELLNGFQSTHPVWDATGCVHPKHFLGGISIHASRMGCDIICGFYRYLFEISIHASRMGCDNMAVRLPPWQAISIHASRMGCDGKAGRRYTVSMYFNPRIPYGMRLVCGVRYSMPVIFQSTHPVWDATTRNPSSNQSQNISIHASRMGCDHTSTGTTPSTARFQSTHPVWDATDFAMNHSQDCKFQSTHPVWDATTLRQQAAEPHGFQSTHPVWDATIQADTTPVNRGISIHASRMGCDIALIAWHRVPRISIHASRMGCDAPRFGSAVSAGISIHASRMGCDSASFEANERATTFQSTHPVWDATRRIFVHTHRLFISIHASRMGCDRFRHGRIALKCDFNPRIPYGMRR